MFPHHHMETLCTGEENTQHLPDLILFLPPYHLFPPEGKYKHLNIRQHHIEEYAKGCLKDHFQKRCLNMSTRPSPELIFEQQGEKWSSKIPHKQFQFG